MSSIRSIDDTVAAGEPLIDLTISFIPGVDYEHATTVLNSLGTDIDVGQTHWYGDARIRSATITAEGAYRLFGVKFRRVPLEIWNPATGTHSPSASLFRWSSERITSWPERAAPFIKSIGTSQPGADDECQDYVPLFDR